MAVAHAVDELGLVIIQAADDLAGEDARLDPLLLLDLNKSNANPIDAGFN